MAIFTTKPPRSGQENSKRFVIILVLAMASGFALRAAGIFDGLPAVFNGDEPHFVNTAVYLGGAHTLNPPFFKYPTLWMYSLLGALGALFAVWSGFGLRHTAQEFGVLFASDPSLFYITARLLACLVSTAAAWVVYATGRLLWNRRVALGAAVLCALLPSLVDGAHYAKWDSMFLLACSAAWYFAVRLYRDGGDKNYVLCGLALGLAVSTHYMAWMLCVILPLAHIARGRERNLPWRAICSDYRLWLGAGLAPAGFLIGTPYAALDFPSFRASIADVFAYARERKLVMSSVDRLDVAKAVVANIVWFAGRSPAILAAAAAFAGLALKFPWLALLFAGPLAVSVVFLSGQPDGGFIRYTFHSVAVLCLLTAVGAEAFAARMRSKAAYPVIIAVLSLLAFAGSAGIVRERLMPDTRTLAARWIERNIAQDTGILMDQPHSSPSIRMGRLQAQMLYRKTTELKNPRAGYFQYLLKSNPQGYRIFEMERSASELATMPAMRASTEQTRELAPLSDTPAQLAARGIRYVAFTSYGITENTGPAAAAFIGAVRKAGSPAAVFRPEPGKTKGPEIRLYRLN
ncbi:MAG: glycosyltransferase family 39 protein [Elusimicrobiaceae bacterium]|nr:glycosyltransferase family 39 protein [Elusimicrobiaceae bacterium]